MKKITILIHCSDQPQIIAAITTFIAVRSGNILYVDQFVDQDQKVFFLRLEAEFQGLSYDDSKFKDDFHQELACVFKMKWEIYPEEYKPKMAIFVSKYDHCLYDILGRHKSGELDVDIPLIVSNHPKLKLIADSFNIPFHFVPLDKLNPKLAESKHLELLSDCNIDFIVLARYMQIIPKNIINKFHNKIINIHHSFLPAFVGAKPYHSAFKRGVKVIGATSHYVTSELDAGPIIEQDVTRVSHTHSINDLATKGRDLEKIVLSSGIKLHLDHKVMVYNNKTIVFS